MNRGKDIKFGDDKRQVSIVESSEQDIYNISNGEPLTDEFGNQLITEVDNFFLPDVSKKRATSVVFAEKEGSYTRTEEVSVASTTATYPNISQNNIGISTANINVGDTIVGSSIPDATFISRIGIGSVYVSNFLTNAAPITEIVSVKRKTQIRARSNPLFKIEEQFKEASEVSTTLLGISRAEVQLSLFSNVSSYGIDPDEFEFYSFNSGTSFNSWESRSNKIYGNRYLAKLTEETQESAIQLTAFPAPYSYPFGPKFQRLGSYNQLLFEQYQRFIGLGNALYDYYNTGGGSFYPSEWKNKFLSKSTTYISGNDVVYAKGTTISFAEIDTWTDTWRDMRTGIDDPVTGGTFNFAKVAEILSEIDTEDLNDVGLNTIDVNSTNTRPGYSDGEQRYAYLQSRRVFRYQPGRISGFTFGVRTSRDPVSGVANEWGISNPTDQYVFRVEKGQLSIVRRSTIPLEQSVLLRNKLKLEDQPKILSGDPFDSQEYWTIEIPRDKFNGDPLDSNGPSGYLLKPENVTMYKIEFGWYGAIGARFYAYIPTDNGEARWVVLHTLVIENSLGSPCLEDSYFRLKYSVNIQSTGDVRTPQYLYKYGASYYIDGGDEGTTQIYSVSSKQKTISSSGITSETSLIGIRPKEFLLNRDGVPIVNKKLIIPTELNVSSDSLSEIKVVTCTACPGFGHVYTPGVATTESGRYVDIEFSDQNTIAALGNLFKTAVTTTGDIGISTDLIAGINTSGIAIGNEVLGLSTIVSVGTTVISIGSGTVGLGTTTLNTTIQTGIGFTFGVYVNSYFYKSDIGAKVVSPSIYNAYVTGVSDPVGTSGSYLSAAIKGFGGYISLNLVDRNIGGSLVLDRVTGIATTVGFGTDSTYPYPIRLSNYDVYAASSVKLFGSTIDIQFANPNSQDSYAHFADFLIGITDFEPDISAPDILNGFITGTGTTTILPNTKILFGEHTHSFAGIDEDGVETGEGWAPPDPPLKMGISSRIPALSNPGGGICSKLTINVLEPLYIDDVNEFAYRPNLPAGTPPAVPAETWIQIQGRFPQEVDYDGGQIAIQNANGTVSVTNSRFVGVTSTYTGAGNREFSYIRISQTLSQGPDFTIAIRPLQATGSLVNSTKLFNYNPYPLYLVAKLKDYASINNISIRETIGDNQRTISPILYVSGAASVTDAGGNANISGEPPTDFREITRSSSALIDLQNKQKLRPYVERDTLYVGANSTQTIDLTPVFGTDKRVIAPDNNNIEATFVLAKKIDAAGFGTVETSLNFKEQ